MKALRLLPIVFLCVFAASPLSAYTVKGKVVSSTGCAAEGALVTVLDVNQLPGGVLTRRILRTGFTDSSGNFSITFPWVTLSGPPAPPTYESGDPDLVFRVTQQIDGTTAVLLDEAASAARWNLPTGSTVTLTATGTATCHATVSAAPANGDFVFTRIGSIPLANIDCAGNVASSGLAYKSTTTATNGDSTNQPFGGAIDVFAFFGSLTGINRYKFEYSADSGASWSALTDPLWDYYYESSTHTWVSESMGPVSEGGVNGLYKLPYVEKPTYAWSFFNRLAVLDSRKVPDGPVLFRIQGYYWNGTTLSTPATLHIDPVYGKIRLEIDNTPPSYSILQVLLNTHPVPDCSFISMTTADQLDIEFKAYDQRGHLGSYSLRAMYGHNQVVSPDPVPPSSPDKAVDGYSNHVSGSLTWTGQTKYTARFTNYPWSSMPRCAYQMRLDVSKRTTNGYGLIYTGLEDTQHIAIQRTDQP